MVEQLKINQTKDLGDMVLQLNAVLRRISQLLGSQASTATVSDSGLTEAEVIALIQRYGQKVVDEDYAKLPGRTGGQNLSGGVLSGDNLTLQANAADALNGDIFLESKVVVNHVNVELDQVTAPTAPTVALGAAGVLNGTYYYGITFVTAQGETGTGDLATLISPVLQKVELSNIPVSSNSRVTSRKIWRTPGTGGNFLKLVATLSDNTTTTYSDNIADGALGANAPYVNTTGGLIYNGSVRSGILDPNVTAWGYGALSSCEGPNNVAVGANSMKTVSTGNSNTAVGNESLYDGTLPSRCVAIGGYAMRGCTTSSNVIAIGYQAHRGDGVSHNYDNVALGNFVLWSITTGYNNIGIGAKVLYSLTTGFNNVAIGDDCMRRTINGYENVAIGKNALNANTSGFQNLAIGKNALVSNSTGFNNIALGEEALFLNESGNGNVAVGRKCLAANISGNNNTAVGANALSGNSGSFNVAFGEDSLAQNTSGASNIGVGVKSAYSNLTGNDNVAIGYQAFLSNLSGSKNVAIGNQSLYSMVSGDANVAIGNKAMQGNNTGANNVAIGTFAAFSITTGYDNVGIGINSLYGITTGYSNTAIGRDTLTSIAGGAKNVAIGQNSQRYAVSTTGNVAIGFDSLSDNVSGSNNVSIGQSALKSNLGGSNNTGVGHLSLYALSTGHSNVGLGRSSLESITTAYENVAVGHQALQGNQTGLGNVAIGKSAGYPSVTSNATVSGNYNTFIGYKSGSGTDAQISNAIAIGNAALVSASDTAVMGNTSTVETILRGSTVTIPGQIKIQGGTPGAGKILQSDLNGLATWATGVTAPVSLGNGGTGAALVDPNADRIFFWDDSAGASTWLAPGNSLAITVTSLDTIQDIRTTATPQFLRMGLGGAANPSFSLITTGSCWIQGTSMLGIGTAPGNARAQITSGTTTIAPIAIGAGTNLTTPISGAIEYDGTDWFMTNVTPTRKTVSFTSDTLAVHAATTSAQLAGVISDETGTGALVFATSPVLVTPALGAASATSLSCGTFTSAGGVTITPAGGSGITASLSSTGVFLVTTNGNEVIKATQQQLGFFGVTTVSQRSAYTQTYATTSRTHALLTGVALASFTGGTVGFTDAAERDNILTQFNALREDVKNIKNVLNSTVDDMQSLGFAA